MYSVINQQLVCKNYTKLTVMVAAKQTVARGTQAPRALRPERDANSDGSDGNVFAGLE